MPSTYIREMVKEDIAYLKNELRNLQLNFYSLRISIDGIVLEGRTREKALKSKINALKIALIKLEAMARSNLLPEHYISLETQETVSRSPGEESLSSNLENAKFYFFGKKQSRKTSGKELSSFILEHDDGSVETVFTIEHREDKTYPHGALSEKVKQGFIDSQTEPKYAIKILKQSLSINTVINTLRVTMRAAYCARLLGGTGLTFRHNNKQYLVTDWYPGFPLLNADLDSIKNCSINTRIALVLDLSEQISILHNKNLLHCDIKPDNVMVSNNTLKLIDLDSIRLKEDMPLEDFSYTERFTDDQFNWDLKYKDYDPPGFDEQSDLYAFGLTIAFLFPELLTLVSLDKIIKLDDNAPITIKAYELQHDTSHHNHEELANLITKLTLKKSQRTDSIDTFIKDLKQLLVTKYKGVLFTASPTNKKLATPSAEKAFKDIETELYEFIHRQKFVNKRILSESNSLDVLINSSDEASSSPDFIASISSNSIASISPDSIASTSSNSIALTSSNSIASTSSNSIASTSSNSIASTSSDSIASTSSDSIASTSSDSIASTSSDSIASTSSDSIVLINSDSENNTSPPRIISMEENNFLIQIGSLLNKTMNLKERRKRLNNKDTQQYNQLNTAIEKALELYICLQTESELYFNNTNKETYKQFKSICIDKIKDARIILESHRGWGQVLANILIAITACIVLYPLALVINKKLTGHYLFFKTDSAKTIDDIEKRLNKISLGET